MVRPLVPIVLLSLVVAAQGARTRHEASVPGGTPVAAVASALLRADRVIPNDNRRAAGTTRDGVLTVSLVAQIAEWHPDGEGAPGASMYAFGEENAAAQIPGPLLRARAGTRAKVTVRNRLPDTLRVYGLHSRLTAANADTLPMVVAPGAVEVVEMQFEAAGTYLYWGTTMRRGINFRTGIDAQLSGAIVIDPTDRIDPRERIFVLGMWSDTVHRAGTHRTRVLGVVNGRSWPNSDHLDYAVGDSVQWRLINASADLHPMHLHGFYFRIRSRGNGRADTTYRDRTGAPGGPLAVTESMIAGQTMRIEWIPEREGNWLFHCHIPEHFGPRGPLGTEPSATAAHDHAQGGMNGLVLGVAVHPRAQRVASTAPARANLRSPTPRRMRLLVRQNIGSSDAQPIYSYALHERGPEPRLDSGQVGAPVLDLVRDQPVRIMVVNRLPEPTAVHWHGIELESFYDGVPGFSGNSSRVTPMIAPGDSFEVRFTPPRAGTFIYHTHANETVQQTAGLAGAIVVSEPGKPRDPATDIPVLVTTTVNPAQQLRVAAINGKTNPETLILTERRTYRFRFIEMNVPRPVMTALLLRGSVGDTLATWRRVAKDGADLPLTEGLAGSARIFMGIGETNDVEFTPSATGPMRLEIGFGAPPGAPLGTRTTLAVWRVEVVSAGRRAQRLKH